MEDNNVILKRSESGRSSLQIVAAQTQQRRYITVRARNHQPPQCLRKRINLLHLRKQKIKKYPLEKSLCLKPTEGKFQHKVFFVRPI